MVSTEDSIVAPRFTRWVRTLLLGGVEGVSLGLAIGILRVSERLLPFVTTNRTSQGVRQAIIASVFTCALLLPSLLLVSCALPNAVGRRLRAFELRTRLLSPLTAVAFIPLLFRAELWKDRMLGFLLMTAVFSIAVMLSTGACLAAAAQIKSSRLIDDLTALTHAFRIRISPVWSLRLSAASIALLALYGLIRTFSAAKTPIPAALAEWALVQKFSAYKDVSLWFTGIGAYALGHASVLGALYSAWTWLWPKAEGLFWLRVFAVSWPALPLMFWTRRSVGAIAGWFLAAAYLSLPVKAMLTENDAFPASFAIGLFFSCGYFLEAKRIGYALLTALATVAVHEQAAIWVIGLGLLSATRDRNTSIGVWLSLAAVGYFSYAAFVLLPHAGVLTYAGGTTTPSGPLHAVVEPMTSSLLNPAYAIPKWIDNQTIEFWLLLLLPLGWLPLRNSRWFVWLLPAILLSYLARFGSDWRTSSFTHFVTLSIASCIVSLGRLKQSNAESRTRYVSAYLGWLAALLPCVVQLGTLWLPIG